MTENDEEKSSLQERFNLKNPRKRVKLSARETAILDEHIARYKEALRRGEFHLKTETRKFGEGAKA